MSIDTDWVDDVRRWYYGGQAPAGDRSPEPTPQPEAPPSDTHMFGHEAALPSLLARHWPDAPGAAETGLP